MAKAKASAPARASAKRKADEIDAEAKEAAEVKKQMSSMVGYLKYHSCKKPVVHSALEASL